MSVSVSTPNNEWKPSLFTIPQLLQSSSICNIAEDEDDDSEDEDEVLEPSGTLLLGDSLIRNVKATKEDVNINCLSGAKFCDLKKFLKGVNPKKIKYSNIFIVCGTNEASTKRKAEKIIKHCRQVLELVKEGQCRFTCQAFCHAQMRKLILTK